jgi:tetratricopeptide (TPR) repeat protein
LNRRGRFKEALAVLDRGMRLFPSYKPLYTNGLIAARGAGRLDIVNELDRRGQEIEDKNPYFIFARGLRYYNSAQYEPAITEFRRASSRKPDSPVILAWLARAFLRAGHKEEARDAFEEVRKLAPDAGVVRDLEREMPELHQ